MANTLATEKAIIERLGLRKVDISTLENSLTSSKVSKRIKERIEAAEYMHIYTDGKSVTVYRNFGTVGYEEKQIAKAYGMPFVELIDLVRAAGLRNVWIGKEELPAEEPAEEAAMQIVYNDDSAIATDKDGNSIHYFNDRGELKPLFAEFEGVIYDKMRVGWKREKSGSAKQAFHDWIEPALKEVYELHYKLENKQYTWDDLFNQPVMKWNDGYWVVDSVDEKTGMATIFRNGIRAEVPAKDLHHIEQPKGVLPE